MDIFQNPVKNWANSQSVLSAHGISLDAPIKLKVRANKQFLLVDNDAKCIGGRFLNHSTVCMYNRTALSIAFSLTQHFVSRIL